MSAERLAYFLVRRIEASDQDRHEELSVAELRRELLPYSACREELGLTTKAEYDLSLLGLLDDPEYLVIQDEELQEAVEQELESPEPGVAFLDQFAASFLELGGWTRNLKRELEEEKAARENGGAAEAGPAPTEAEADGEPRATRDEEEPVADAGSEDEEEAGDRGAERVAVEPGGSCVACGEDLPERDDLRFCPYCGTDQTVPRCGECGSEVEESWAYCPSCGSAVG